MEVAPTGHHTSQKLHKPGKWMGPSPRKKSGHIESSYLDAELPPLNPQRQLDIIWETQFQARPSNKGNIYKNILASIGLDCPRHSWII